MKTKLFFLNYYLNKYQMDDKLLKVKVVFDKVREMRNEIGTLFEGLDGRITIY